jgi:hypothetical protein
MKEERLARVALERLRVQVEGEGSPLCDALVPASAPVRAAPFGPLVAQGPRARECVDEYATLVEAILEGYLLHYGGGRVFDSPSPELRLLAGDYLYAFGLARLAELGDIDAIDELADLISLCAQAHAAAPDGAEGRTAWRLTGALWALAALAIGAGDWPEHREAKRRAREEGIAVSEHVLDVASARAEQLGLEHHLGRALIGFDRVTGGEFAKT